MRFVRNVSEFPHWHGKAREICLMWGSWGITLVLRWNHKDYMVGVRMND